MIPSYPQQREESPRASANWLSRISFLWVWKIMLKSYRQPLEIQDIPKVLPGDRAQTIAEEVIEVWNNHVLECSVLKSKPSLAKVLYKVYGKKFIKHAIVCFLNESLILLMQPISLAFLMQYLQVPEAGKQDDADWLEYLSTAGIIFSSVWYAITNHYLQFEFHHLWTHIRIACSVLIYNKSMRMSQNSLGTSYVSEAISLMSTDVNRLDELEIFCIYLLIAPIQLLLAIGVLWSFVGLPALVGILVFAIYIPFECFLGGRFLHTRQKTNLKRDHRLRILAEIFTCIKEIKMYGWEKFFMNKASVCRKDELRYVKTMAWLRAVNAVLSFTLANFVAFLTLLIYVLANGKENYLSPKVVFVTLNFYSNLRFIVTIFFARGVEDMAEILIVLERIQGFLLLKDMRHRKKYSLDDSNLISNDDTLIEMNDCTFRAQGINTGGHPVALSNITFQLKGGGVTMLIGPGGSGKSTLLQAVMGHIPSENGIVATNGRIAFLSGSDPWIFHGTVEENILFGRRVRYPWYEQVINACEILEVIECLPNKDTTKIDSSTISKGHSCRIALARAVYSDAHIYLFDDCLVHIDTHAARRIMDKCISELLRHKLIFLATTQLQFLEYADRIILLHRGKIRLNGSYAVFRAQQSKFIDEAHISDDLNVISAMSLQSPTTTINDYVVEAKYSDASITESNQMMVVRRQAGRLPSVTSIRAHHDIHEGYFLHAAQSQEEMVSSSSFGIRSYGRYIQIGSNWFVSGIFLLLCFVTQTMHSGLEYWLERFTKTEEVRHRTELYDKINDTSIIYKYKLNANVPVATVCTGSWYCFIFTTERSVQIIFFGIFTLTLVAISLIRTIMFYGVCVNSSTNAYNGLMNSLLRAPAKIFDVNTTSRILNRLSQDINTIDDHLPVAMYELLDTFSVIVGTLILVSALSIYFLMPSVTVLIIFFILQIFHQKSTKSLKRLEGVTRSPIMTTLTTTLSGLSTIHSFGQEEMFYRKFYEALDVHTSTWYVFLSAQRWLGFVVGWIIMAYISIVTLTFIEIHEHEDPAEVGLGIHSAISLAQLFQWYLRTQSEVDAMVVSVERIAEFTQILPEADWETKKQFRLHLTGWPTHGDIVFDRVFVNCVHNSDNHSLLRNLSFHIHPREKIGIVGRTGCGKTLLLSTILRIVEPSSGKIIIDDINISYIGLHDLRQKMAVVPAEPEILLGTVRENYDPLGLKSDAEIWEVLADTYLFDTIKALPMGLDTELDDEGSQFTLAQKQLVCLGRALLNGSQVVLCDLNPESDELIQEIIQCSFRHCTVVASAHQLHSAIEFDRLIVLQDGKIDDFDEPYNLLQKKEGAFFDMIQHCTPQLLKTYLGLAKETRDNRGRAAQSRKSVTSQKRSMRLFSTWKRLNSSIFDVSK